MPEPVETSDKPRSDRRGFLNAMIGAAIAGWLAAVIYPALRYLKPLPSSGPGGPIELTGEDAAKLKETGYVIVRAGDKRLIVMELEGEVRAFSAVCTHEGCTVQYLSGESIIWCACHNGRFDVDGTVLSGPPPRPLPQYAAKRDGEGNVVVTPEEA